MADNVELSGRCAVHPERHALGLCSRCGSYFCEDCAARASAAPLRSACAARATPPTLAETRERCWGKRDGWVWLFGSFVVPLIGVVGIVFGVSTLRKLERSTEPVGNRKLLAVAGLVLSGAGALLWLLAIGALIQFATRL